MGLNIKMIYSLEAPLDEFAQRLNKESKAYNSNAFKKFLREKTSFLTKSKDPY
jgi:hypothetical protein